MEKWSILSDVVKYVQYNQHTIGHYELEVKVPEERYGTKMYNKLWDPEREVKEVSFDPESERLTECILDVFEGVKSAIIYTAKYDENNDKGMTYLGKSKTRRQDELKAEHKAPITEGCYI